ncbi:MAG: ABC transporter substrate-binding protein, partial [Promethearchaeota archaeon]
MRKVGIFEKKNIIIVGLAIALAASGVGNVLLATRQLQPEITPNKPLVLSANPATLILDPLNAVDFASKLFLEQVVETLFTYNLSSLSLPRIPHLAESYWWENATTLHIKLREGILFHDLTAFNANTTKWNFDRILYLSNCTSLLPSTISLGEYASLYFMPDGVTPIINHVDSNREYNVTIFLNGSYAPFLDLLCHISSAMVSPYSTRDNSYIEPKYERIVGTGPFIYKYFLPRYKSYVAELRLDSFRLYWQEEPFFKEIIVVFYDPTWRCPYIIDYDVDWPTNFLTYDISTIETYDYATVMKFTDIYGLPRLDYQYLGMNNKHISLPWRKAISYAINYTYIIEELLNDFVVRA